MTNVIRFEIKTDGYYTPDEQVDLLEGFVDFMRNADDDVIEDSEKFEFHDVDDAPVVPEHVKNEIIKDFIDNTKTEFQIQVRLKNDDTEVPGSIAAYSGFLETCNQ